MKELAQILKDDLDKKSKAEWFKEDEKSKALIEILGDSEKQDGSINWNIEDLLTRLHQIRETCLGNNVFPEIETKIGDTTFKDDIIEGIEKTLLKFIVDCFGLNGYQKTKRDNDNKGSVEYVANFIKFLGRFQNPIKIFTTNNDICLEAALVRLSQENYNLTEKRYHLIDGFSTGLIPTFSIDNYAIEATSDNNKIPVCYWKLHGSIDWVFTSPLGDEQSNEEKYGDEKVICKKINDSLWEDLSQSNAIESNVLANTNRIMIFPTPAKYSQTYVFPYMELYEAFRRTLQEVDFLLVIGTGFPDNHINSAIKSFLKRNNTHMYIVDPEIDEDIVASRIGKHTTLKPIIKDGFLNFVEKMLKFED